VAPFQTSNNQINIKHGARGMYSFVDAAQYFPQRWLQHASELAQ
jgi:hypothetical protein